MWPSLYSDARPADDVVALLIRYSDDWIHWNKTACEIRKPLPTENLLEDTDGLPSESISDLSMQLPALLSGFC